MKIPSEKAISCLQKAITRLPDLPRVSILLAQYLFRRFKMTVSDDDYNEGMAVLDKVINFRGPEDKPSPYEALALNIAVLFSLVRFRTSGKPEHLEQAIYLNRTLHYRFSLEHPARDLVTRGRSVLQEFRIDGSGVTPSLETLIPESGRLPSFCDLTALPELSVKHQEMLKILF